MPEPRTPGCCLLRAAALEAACCVLTPNAEQAFPAVLYSPFAPHHPPPQPWGAREAQPPGVFLFPWKPRELTRAAACGLHKTRNCYLKTNFISF